MAGYGGDSKMTSIIYKKVNYEPCDLVPDAFDRWLSFSSLHPFPTTIQPDSRKTISSPHL